MITGEPVAQVAAERSEYRVCTNRGIEHYRADHAFIYEAGVVGLWNGKGDDRELVAFIKDYIAIERLECSDD